MSLSKSDILENIIVGYVKKPCLLREKAEITVAFELCRHDELAIFFREQGFANNFTNNQFKEWKKTIERKSVALCETLPLPREVKFKVIIAVKSLALQLLIWRTHHRGLFDVLPDFTSRPLTSVDDWFTEGILNGKKLAEYLVKNTGIPVYQRYRIACIYCLKQHILSLWNQMSSEQKNFCISEDFQLSLVNLWSRYIAGRVDRFIGNEDLFWQDALEAAIKGGQKTAAVHCWKALNESTKEDLVMNAALDLAVILRDKKELELGLPMTTYYMDISCFLLSEMNEYQRIAFFEETSKDYLVYALEYFLEWPYQEYFLPVITILWDILDEWVYGELLLYIAKKHADPDEYHDYDYGSLLEAVLARTPESYKRYLFHHPNNNTHCMAEMLLLIITKIESFDNNRDLSILQRILNMATKEEKLSLLYSNSDIQLCECLITEGNLELFDLVLKQCLPEEDINDFRKQFVLSSKGHFYYSELIWNNELKEADLFLEWGSLSAEEICEFKAYMFNKFQNSFVRSIANRRIDFVDKLLNFFLPCAEAQKQFKKNLIEEYGCILCFNFLQEARWEELDKVLFWCLESEESVEKFKQEIFPVIATDIHFLFMCNNLWEDAVLFFQYFHLSPKDIEKLKSETLMSHDVFNSVYDMLFNDNDDQTIQLFLKWCFSDKQTLEEFFKRVKQKCRLGRITAKKLHMLQKVDKFLKERLHDLADAEQGNTESHCWKNKRNSSEESSFVKRMRCEKYSHPYF